MTKVIIATCDDFTKETIKHCVRAVNPGLQIIDGSNDTSLVYHLKSAEDDILFFDKYFLGYILKFKIKALKTYNPKLRIVFCEKGICSTFFGLRVHDLKVDGFISNITNCVEFENTLKLVFSGKPYFPDYVYTAINKNIHLRNRTNCAEITEIEMAIGIYLGEGKSIKEICDFLDIKPGSVRTLVTRLKNKIGCESMNDFAVLNRQLEKINYRSWNC